MLRRTLRGLIVFLVGAGLIAVVYATRPDVPLGSRLEQPATLARSASTARALPISTGQARDALVPDAVEPNSPDLHLATIRPGRSKRFEKPMGPRAELVSEPRSVGWGDSYAVRLTSSGRPVVVSQIVLVALMADSTVENIAMGALPERGIYRATVPTRRSAPITLRVRVSYRGEQWVEIPVR